jgi:hypothetical protein
MHTEKGGTILYPPFADVTPLGTVFVFDHSELPIVEALLTSLIRTYRSDNIDEFYYKLRAIREDVRANMPEVIQ